MRPKTYNLFLLGSDIEVIQLYIKLTSENRLQECEKYSSKDPKKRTRMRIWRVWN